MQRKHLTFDDCYRILDVSPRANAEQIQQAFRQLARAHHPDVNPERRDHQRFVEIVHAYRILRERLRRTEEDPPFAACRFCGKFEDLFDPFGTGSTCAACLLGITDRSRLLPAPVVVVLRHLAVFLLYSLSVLGAFQLWNAPALVWGLLAVGGAASGIILLAYQVMRVTPARRASVKTQVR